MYRNPSNAPLKFAIILAADVIIGLFLGIPFWTIVLLNVLSLVAAFVAGLVVLGILSARGVPTNRIVQIALPLAHAVTVGVYLYLGITLSTMFWFLLWGAIILVIIEFLAPTYD